MDCIVGPIPRGGNFLPRPEIVEKIYEKLSEHHIYISGPRRVGKSGIMKYLEDNPRENYEFRYIIVQACDNPVDFYKCLLEETKGFKSISKKSLAKVSNLLEKLESLKLFWVEIKLKHKLRNFQEECKEVYRMLETNGKTLVIMIDEFAQTVDNISRKLGEPEARTFLYANREMQLNSSPNVRFIYTGSLGLEPLCGRLDAADALTALATIRVGPLPYKDGKVLCEKILKGKNINCDEEVIAYILAEIEWLGPFYIQLTLDDIIDQCRENDSRVTKVIVDKTLSNITSARSNHYLNQYETHIKKIYENIGNQYKFIRKFLKVLSNTSNMKSSAVRVLVAEFNESESLNNIIETLEYDGYIYQDSIEDEIAYRFTSGILKKWWARHM